jgi:hypothetical protein
MTSCVVEMTSTAPKVKLTTNVQNIVLNISNVEYEIKGISCQTIRNISEIIRATKHHYRLVK